MIRRFVFISTNIHRINLHQLPSRLSRLLTLIVAVVLSQAIDLHPVHAESDARPNIILMMSDDMGYSDIGCYGGEIKTPNLDNLAAGGLQFTQFYNTARCCPTRAALLTGLYSHQAGIGHMTGDYGRPGYRGDLNKNCLTIAEALRLAGYRTMMSGKWHVTKHLKPEGPKHNWPLQRGFDKFYGTILGAGSFYDPATLVRNNTMISPQADKEYQSDQYYYTDAISDNAVKYINQHRQENSDAPFFMYVPYTAAHWPMQALEKDVAKYHGKYDQGYAAIRRQRFARMKKLGLIDKDLKLSPQAGNWSKVKDKAWEARGMEVYAAMIDNMDQGVGRIVAALKKNDLYENTLIFFLQDNGGCAEPFGRTPRTQLKTRPENPLYPPMAKEELQLSMVPKQTRDGFPFVTGKGLMPGPDGTYIGYGKNWANVSNTPFREYKHWTHEGGVSTPLIAHWPEGIQGQGSFVSRPGHLVDLMATCIELAGAEYPRSYQGHQITPLAGESLADVLQGKEAKPRGPIYWEHEGNRAVREGRWKIVSKYPGGWELYDIKTDRSELHNLAQQQPEKLRQLVGLYQSWAKRSLVEPWKDLPRGKNRNKKTGQRKNAAKKK